MAELPTKERGGEISEEWSEDLLDVAPPPFSNPSRALATLIVFSKECPVGLWVCTHHIHSLLVNMEVYTKVDKCNLRMSSACCIADPPNPFLCLFFAELLCFSASWWHRSEHAITKPSTMVTLEYQWWHPPTPTMMTMVTPTASSRNLSIEARAFELSLYNITSS